MMQCYYDDYCRTRYLVPIWEIAHETGCGDNGALCEKNSISVLKIGVGEKGMLAVLGRIYLHAF